MVKRPENTGPMRDAEWAALRRLWRGLDPEGRRMVLWFAQEMARQAPAPAATPSLPPRGKD
jgi:hypothetical protein